MKWLTHWDDDQVIVIHTLTVHPRHLQQGVGRLLMAFAYQHAAASCSDDFIVWVGIAVSTDYSSNDIQSIISSIPELKNAEIIPYSLEMANQYRFSGIQKEIPGSQSDDYYLIGLSIKPKIIIDKRNQ